MLWQELLILTVFYAVLVKSNAPLVLSAKVKTPVLSILTSASIAEFANPYVPLALSTSNSFN